MSKIAQIACSESQDAEGNQSRNVYSLSDDGRAFQLHDQEKAADTSHYGNVGIWTAFWRPLPDLNVTMPTFVPTVAGKSDRDVAQHWYVKRLADAAKAKAAQAAAAAKPAPADVF